MGIMQKTAIIVPCYNEELRLDSSAFAEFGAKNPELHFIFVNDGSTDGTEKKLADLSRLNPSQMHFISLERNYGKAEAVRRGFIKALGMDFVNIGYWDADLSTPLTTIPRFCELLNPQGISLVIGSRVRLLGRRIRRRAIRHYLGRIFATCASLFLQLPVYDTQCGAKLFKNSKELKVIFGKPFIVNWTFDVEILARFILAERFMGTGSLKERALEYPLEEWTGVPGSKVKPIDFAVAFVELVRIFLLLHAPGAGNRFLKLAGIDLDISLHP
jgi:glycosyltransferase involved in cell wall biosynthesis